MKKDHQREPEYMRDGGHEYTRRRDSDVTCAICGFNQYNDTHKLSLKERLLQAVETAITDEHGLDGADGEALLREAGYWPSKREKGGSPL